MTRKRNDEQTRQMEYRLSKSQQRNVLALDRERRRVVAELQECDQAIDEFAHTIHNGPGICVFQGRPDGSLVLVVTPEAQPAGPDTEPAPPEAP